MPVASALTDPTGDPFVIARAAAEQIQAATGITRHEIALTLGSGWSGAAEKIGETVCTIPATDIIGFDKAGVAGHVGVLRSIALPGGKHALVMGARTHLYEGRGVRSVVHSVRTAAACGAEIMVLTNGAGGLKEHWKPGTPVLISDQINLTATSPLEGATFIDLTDLYSMRLRDLARSVDPTLDEGVYCQFPGPQYETPAEVRMVRAVGGHIVGMSTALEAIAARQCGLEVLGMSLITNLAAGIGQTPLSHQEVLEAGQAAEPVISALLAKIIERL